MSKKPEQKVTARVTCVRFQTEVEMINEDGKVFKKATMQGTVLESEFDKTFQMAADEATAEALNSVPNRAARRRDERAGG